MKAGDEANNLIAMVPGLAAFYRRKTEQTGRPAGKKGVMRRVLDSAIKQPGRRVRGRNGSGTLPRRSTLSSFR